MIVVLRARTLTGLSLIASLLTGCAPTQYVAASSPASTDMALAQFECEERFRAVLAQQMAVNPYGGLAGFSKGRYMRQCMKAHGYEAVD